MKNNSLEKIKKHIDLNIQEIIKKMNNNNYGKEDTFKYMSGYKDALIDILGYIKDIEKVDNTKQNIITE